MPPFTSRVTLHNGNESTPYTKEIEINDVAPNQVLVKTHFASINPIDIKLYIRQTSTDPTHTVRDISGTVEVVGSDLTSQYKVGEKVYGSVLTLNDKNFIGSYSILEINNINVLEPLPEGLNFEQGASLGIVFSTAHEMLQRAAEFVKLDKEARILVLGGATAVGSFVIELAKKHFNVGTVIATCSPSSSEYVKDYGADDVINYRDSNFPHNIANYVKSSAKFDAVLDLVGGNDVVNVYPKILKPASQGNAFITVVRANSHGATYGSNKTVSYPKAVLNSISNLSPTVYRYVVDKLYGLNHVHFVVSKREFIETAKTFFMIPGVKVPIDSIFPIKDFKLAWDKVDSTRARGKVLVEF